MSVTQAERQGGYPQVGHLGTICDGPGMPGLLAGAGKGAPFVFDATLVGQTRSSSASVWDEMSDKGHQPNGWRNDWLRATGCAR